MRLRCLEWPIGPYPGLIEMAAAIEGQPGHPRHSERRPPMRRSSFCGALEVSFTPDSGHRQHRSMGPLWVDAVEKVENRTTPKISQMLIFGPLRRCDAL